MRFLVDNQLPSHLAGFLRDLGHDAIHVIDVKLDAADDRIVWAWAIAENRILISKDEDFLFLANRSNDLGKFVWVRLGNCRKTALVDAFTKSIDAIVVAFDSGQRIVELS